MRSSFVEDFRVIATFLFCRILEGDSYVLSFVIPTFVEDLTFLFCRT